MECIRIRTLSRNYRSVTACLGDLRKCSELYERWLPRTESTVPGPNVSNEPKYSKTVRARVAPSWPAPPNGRIIPHPARLCQPLRVQPRPGCQPPPVMISCAADLAPQSIMTHSSHAAAKVPVQRKSLQQAAEKSRQQESARS
jgi:hypothetical protein